MGRIILHTRSAAVEVDDVLLEPLAVVVTRQLRRDEPVMLDCVNPPDEEPARSSIWLHPAMCVTFEFDSESRREIDPAVLEEMARSAERTGTIVLFPEARDRSGDADSGRHATLRALPRRDSAA